MQLSKCGRPSLAQAAFVAAAVLAASGAVGVSPDQGRSAAMSAAGSPGGNVITSAAVGIPQTYNTGAAAGTPTGTRGPYTNGDTWYNTWAADGNIYATSDDSNGFPGTCSSNLVVNKITGSNPGDLSSPFVNCMTSYGGEGDQQDYRDGRTWKTDGIISVDGTLYVVVCRQQDGAGGYPYGFQPSSNASIIKSADGGRTWSNSFGATGDTGGAAPTYNAQLSRADAMFSGNSFSTPEFIQYGEDDNKASTADGGDNYVYAISNNGYAYDGSDMILGRVLRSKIGALDAADWQFYTGPQGGNGMDPADWSSSVARARPILTAPYELSQSGINYIQPLHLYVMTSFYFPVRSSWPSTGVTSHWNFYEAPHPWGPWTRFFNEPTTECYFACTSLTTSQLGLYDPSLISKFISMDGLNNVIFSTGDWTSPSRPNDYLYHLHAWPLTLTTKTEHVVDDSSPAAQYSGHGWSFTRDDGGCFEATDHYSDQPGDIDVASYTFTGTSIAWVGSKADNHGHAAVSVDGGPTAIIDSYSPAKEYQQVLFSRSGLSAARHTITITVLNQKAPKSRGTYSDIDAFIVGGARRLRACHGGVGRGMATPATRVMRPREIHARVPAGMSRRRRRFRLSGRRAQPGLENREEYEMKFLISMHINPAVLDALTDEEKAAIGAGHGTFMETLKKSGEFISTQALADPSQAAVVSVRNGQPVVTDGPFLESKEYLGGFYLIDCENKERAIELAAQIPDSAIAGLGVEVRQVMFADGQLEP